MTENFRITSALKTIEIDAHIFIFERKKITNLKLCTEKTFFPTRHPEKLETN